MASQIGDGFPVAIRQANILIQRGNSEVIVFLIQLQFPYSSSLMREVGPRDFLPGLQRIAQKEIGRIGLLSK